MNLQGGYRADRAAKNHGLLDNFQMPCQYSLCEDILSPGRVSQYIIPWDEKELGNADLDPTEGALNQSATDEKKKDWEWKSLFNVVDIQCILYTQ